MNANKILTIALDLQKAHTKLELVDMARAFGWRGDHARASMLQIALFVGTKLAEDEQPDDQQQQSQKTDQQQQPDQSDDQQQPDQSEQPEKAEQSQQSQQPEKPHQSQQPDQSDDQQQPDQSDDQQQSQKTEQQQSQKTDQQPEQPEQSDDQQQSQKTEQQQQSDDHDFEEDPHDKDMPDQSDRVNDVQWRAMLKAAGIDRPHQMLRKVYTVAVIGGLIPMLIGEAGTGKTHLAEQLGKLLRVPFSSISCTEGMSESHLTGWLLPVGDAGRFDYVPSPFVQSIQQQSVFLLDELDAADGNVLLVMNSLLSNGFLTVPHKLENPTIRHHPESIIIMGVNSPNGATELYGARGKLDASTLDRVYPVEVDYDVSYEKSLFVIPGQKRRVRSTEWTPATVEMTEESMGLLSSWFFSLRSRKNSTKVKRVVSSRMAKRLVAATLAGVPVDEAKADNLVFWTVDERRRVGESA